MAVGRDLYGTQDYPLIHEAIVNGAWTQTRVSTTSVYRGHTDYSFRSRAIKPVPLSNTKGTITRYRQNTDTIVQQVTSDSRIIGPACMVAKGPSSHSVQNEDGAGLSPLALKRLNTRELNLGVILVEGRETYNLLASTATTLVEAYKLLRSKNAKGALQALGVPISGKHGKRIDNNTIENGAADSWLQIQFGWLPLLNDVYTAVGQSYKALSEGKLVRGQARRGSKRGSDTFDPSYVPSSRVSWSGTVSSPRLAWLQSFGLLNPLTLAWEATRLSYLVDWLFHVNTFLNSMTATAGLTNTRSSIVTERLSRYVRGGHATSTLQTVTRDVGASITLGNPLNFDMGGWHVATALAQAKQVFRNPR